MPPGGRLPCGTGAGRLLVVLAHRVGFSIFCRRRAAYSLTCPYRTLRTWPSSTRRDRQRLADGDGTVRVSRDLGKVDEAMLNAAALPAPCRLTGSAKLCGLVVAGHTVPLRESLVRITPSQERLRASSVHQHGPGGAALASPPTRGSPLNLTRCRPHRRSVPSAPFRAHSRRDRGPFSRLVLPTE
jgi:hypothetical protein